MDEQAFLCFANAFSMPCSIKASSLPKSYALATSGKCPETLPDFALKRESGAHVVIRRSQHSPLSGQRMQDHHGNRAGGASGIRFPRGILGN